MLRSLGIGLGVIALVLLVAFGLTQLTPHPHHKKLYGKIYQGSDHHYYTRSYNDDDSGVFYYWMYVDSSSPSRTPATSPFSGGTWTRISTVPSGLTPTTKVVVENGGRPTKEVEDEKEIDAKEEITEETTEAEAASADAAASEIEATSPEESPDVTPGTPDAPTSEPGTDSDTGDSGGDSGDGGD